MSLNLALIAELKQEAASTRKMLEKVPTEHNEWKPHEKSMKLGRLATHVAELSGWIMMTIKTDELNFANFDYKPVTDPTSEQLLAIHDDNVRNAIEVLETATDEDLAKIWTMRNGDQVIMALPKSVVLRSMCFNHVYHHRGQLSVYLRELNVPVPGMYSPSADDRAAM